MTHHAELITSQSEHRLVEARAVRSVYSLAQFVLRVAID
jgi:hypothetical protein